MQYPLQHSGDGAFAYPDDIFKEVAATIMVILTTLPGEHPRIPDFGNHAALLLFNNPNEELDETIKAMIKNDIETWEPRAQVTDVETYFDSDTATYIIRVHYQVSGIEDVVETSLKGAM